MFWYVVYKHNYELKVAEFMRHESLEGFVTALKAEGAHVIKVFSV